jgi:isopentenyl diphosphate isomerase/L-lactate dehydrogenase-like FMN-dependent dehydrogenase
MASEDPKPGSGAAPPSSAASETEGAAAPAETGAAPGEGGRDRDRDEEEQEGFIRQVIPDLLRRTVYAGMAAVFSTDEGVRRIVSEMKLPREVANYVVQQAASSKDELFKIVAREVRGFLDSMNVSGELKKLLTSLSFEVKTEIRFIPNDEAVGIKPEVRRRVAVKRDGKEVDSE